MRPIKGFILLVLIELTHFQAALLKTTYVYVSFMHEAYLRTIHPLCLDWRSEHQTVRPLSFVPRPGAPRF